MPKKRDHPNCCKAPDFGKEGTKKPEYCKPHAKDGMVDVVKKRRVHPGGIATQPSIGREGTKKVECCSKHAKQGMVDVRSKICQHLGCTAISRYC